MQRRVALLLVAFIAGITLGIVIAERMYVEANRHRLKTFDGRGLAIHVRSLRTPVFLSS